MELIILVKAKGPSGSSRSGISNQRNAKISVRSSKKRTVSSTRWLARQLNDPYVAAAKTAGYRSRAAYKLRELDDRYKFLTPGARVVDLGASPGGWTQVAIQRVGEKGCVVALDIMEVDSLKGATVIMADILSSKTIDLLRAALGGSANVVLSDMAAPSTGHAKTDHLRVMVLAEAAHSCACSVLEGGGTFVVKLLRGGADHGLLANLKKNFRRVKHVKPVASRSDSREIYMVATGFRGATT